MGDYNVIPTDEDVYKPERWLKDALFAPEAKEKYRELSRRAGPTRSGSSTPASASSPSGITGGTRSARRRHPYRSPAAEPALSKKLKRAGVDARRAAGRRPATMRLCGSRSKFEITAADKAPRFERGCRSRNCRACFDSSDPVAATILSAGRRENDDRIGGT